MGKSSRSTIHHHLHHPSLESVAADLLPAAPPPPRPDTRRVSSDDDEEASRSIAERWRRPPLCFQRTRFEEGEKWSSFFLFEFFSPLEFFFFSLFASSSFSSSSLERHLPHSIKARARSRSRSLAVLISLFRVRKADERLRLTGTRNRCPDPAP